MKNDFYFAICVISVIIIFYSVYSVLPVFNLPLETKTLEVNYIVGPITGLDVNSSALKFGEIVRGGSSARTVILENNHNFPISVVFVPSKNIEDVINFNRTKQTIEVNETKIFSVILTVPQDKDFGRYDGNFSALIYRAGN